MDVLDNEDGGDANKGVVNQPSAKKEANSKYWILNEETKSRLWRSTTRRWIWVWIPRKRRFCINLWMCLRMMMEMATRERQVSLLPKRRRYFRRESIRKPIVCKFCLKRNIQIQLSIRIVLSPNVRSTHPTKISAYLSTVNLSTEQRHPASNQTIPRPRIEHAVRW